MSTNDRSLANAIFNSQRDEILHDRRIQELHRAALRIIKEASNG